MFDHCVENRQQFAHATDQRDLRSLTGIAQPLVKGSDDAVTSACNQGCHVQRCAYGGSAAPDCPTTSKISAVAIDRSDADQCCDLLSVELSKSRELRYESTTNHRTNPG